LAVSLEELHEDAMDKSKFAEPRAFHVDNGWYDAYWLQQARASAARSITQAMAASLTRLGRLAVGVIWARQALSAMPCDLKPCANGDEVARARQLLLGDQGKPHRSD
jgi:hypothetical protein